MRCVTATHAIPVNCLTLWLGHSSIKMSLTCLGLVSDLNRSLGSAVRVWFWAVVEYTGAWSAPTTALSVSNARRSICGLGDVSGRG